MGLSSKNFKKIDSLSKDLLTSFVDKGFIISKSKEIVYKIGDLGDVVNNKEFISLSSFSLNLQEIINQGLEEAQENKPYMYQNIEIGQSRYNIVVLSLSFDAYFLISFIKNIRTNYDFLNYNHSRANNYNITLNEISNFLNNSMITAISIDMDKNISNYTKDIDKVFDVEDDVVGETISSLTPKFFNYPRILTNINQVLINESVKTLHTTTKENTIYSVRISPYYNNENDIQIGAIISFQDITLLKANENELTRQKQEFEEILNTIYVGMINFEVILDKSQTPIDLKVLYVNDKITKYLNVERQHLIGKTIKELIPKIDNDLIELYGNVAITMNPHQQIHYLDFIGGYRDVRGMSINKGQVFVSFLDVSEQMKARKEIEDKILRHGMILESAKTGFFEMNLRDEEIYLDAFCISLYKEEVTYKKSREQFRERVHPEDLYRVLELNNRVLIGELEKANHVFRFLNIETKEYLWIRMILIPAEKENGKAVRMLGLYSDIDEQKKADEKAEESERLLKETNKVASIARFIFNTKLNTFHPSAELCDFLGVERMVSLNDFRQLVHKEDLKIYDEGTEYIQNHPEGKVTKYRILTNDKIRYIQSSVYGQRDDYGYVAQVFGLLKDITEIEESRLESELHRMSFELIFNSNPAGIFLTDDTFTITMFNETFKSIVEETVSLKQLLGKDYQMLIAILKKGGKVSNHKLEYSFNKAMKFFSLNMIKIDETFNNSYQATIVDITREVEVTDQINYIANHDVLTGLYNRNFYEGYIKEHSKMYPTGVIVCDIDGLKVINDAFGHLKGDELLVVFANILKDTFQKQMLFRIGGDEFCIILQNTSLIEMRDYEKIIKSKLSEVELYGMGFDVSIGNALLEDENTTFSDTFVKAENMMYRRKLLIRNSRKSRTLETIMDTLNKKTDETLDHCENVSRLSVELLKEIGFARQYDIEQIEMLSRIHDIGKIIVSDEILNKTSTLTKEEYGKMKQHSESGYKIAKSILDSEDIALGVLYHHERIDGKGYPHNLVGEEIPVFARIIAITDAYDAMTGFRKYKLALNKEEAIQELRNNSGTQFDSEYVEKFIEILKKA